MYLRFLTLILCLITFSATAGPSALVVENNTQHRLSVLDGYAMEITLEPQSSYTIHAKDTYVCTHYWAELCDLSVTLNDNNSNDELSVLGTIRLKAHGDMTVQRVFTREPLVISLKQSTLSNIVTINESDLTLPTLTSPYITIHNSTYQFIYVRHSHNSVNSPAPIDGIAPWDSQIIHADTFLESCEDICEMTIGAIVFGTEVYPLAWFTLDVNDNLKILDTDFLQSSGVMINQMGPNELEVVHSFVIFDSSF